MAKYKKGDRVKIPARYATVTVGEKDGGWVTVELDDGGLRYVEMRHVKAIGKKALKRIEEAKRQEEIKALEQQVEYETECLADATKKLEEAKLAVKLAADAELKDAKGVIDRHGDVWMKVKKTGKYRLGAPGLDIRFETLRNMWGPLKAVE